MPTKIRSISMSHIGNLKLQVPLTLLIVAVAAIALVLTQTTTTNPTPAEAQSGGSEPKVSASRCGAASDLNGRIVKVADAIVYAINKDIAADNVQARRDHTSGPTPTLIPDIDMCSEVTATQIADIETLDIRGVGLTELRASDLAGLTSLTRLRLGNNSLTSLNQSTFSSLTTLTVLDLRKNRLTSLHQDLFQGLTNLETLGLGENRLSSLHEDIFDGLTNLEVLELDQTALISLHEDVFDGLSNLEELQLDQNLLTTSDLDEDIFDGLSNLSELDLSSNVLTSLHEDIFDGLSSLDNLALESNSLTSLHEDIFDGLSNLTTLDISDNALGSLHEDIFDGLSNLAYLYIFENPLGSLHEDIFDGLSSLYDLDLSSSVLTSLHENIFEDTSDIAYLDLNDNLLSSLHEDIFDGFSSLEWLDLSSNSLGNTTVNPPTTLHEDLFEDIGNADTLEFLYLDNNNLPSLHADTFDDFSGDTLLDLGLSRNLIQNLDANILPSGITALFLNGNSLNGPPDNLSSLTSLTVLDLYHNPLNSLNIEPADFDSSLPLETLRLGLTDPTSMQLTNYQAQLADLDTLKVQGPCGRSPLDGRTQAVIDAITNALPARVTCAAVTWDDLTAIRDLDLSNENIATLKGEEEYILGDFEGLTGLRTLDLSDNDLTRLTYDVLADEDNDGTPEIEERTSGIFYSLDSLEELNLCDNQITSWDEGATGVFAFLESLDILRLCNNQISTVSGAMFGRSIPTLETLDLSGNNLRSLDRPSVFDPLSLLTLDLSNNDLQFLHVDAFEGFYGLQVLHLRGNQLSNLPLEVWEPLGQLLRTLSVNQGAIDEQEVRRQIQTLQNIEISGQMADPDRTPLPGEPTFTPVVATSTPIPAGRILRIKPSVESISIRAGSKVRLSVSVFGLQNEQDDSLAEKEEVTFEWSSSNGQGSFEESAPAGAETNGEPDDRKVLHTVSDIPGSYTVTATLGQGECRGTDEQCSASVKITVIRTIEREASATPVPCQISGTIPAAIPDSAGNQHSVFTPTDGGTFTDENVEVTAPINAVAGCEYIGIRVVESGSAVNRNNPLYRYTLAGMLYSVQAVDSSGAMITDYQFNRPIRVCVPLPGTLRGNISEIDALKVNSDGTLTSLTSKILSTPNGNPRVCGNLSELPADIAAGKRGAPDPTPEPMPTATPEPPETGGTAVPYTWVWLIAILGIGIFVLGAATLTRRRETATITTTTNTRA